ncbi:T-cell surface glycoprotein CD8 beta chain [Talpa occidentalis]|uniref:T-cell surface glycoprotein CD8 beta chain n=1 Tax=Talpa occidentalis TaxID=50954 RepID=UPI001890AED8|nr:T-cell surface glycoprotein CD8 beta chain [Talpa occidentalis]
MQPRLWLLLAAQLTALHQVAGSLIIQTSQTATLKCDIRDASANIRIYWLRQPQALNAASRLEFLASYEASKNTGNGQKYETGSLNMSWTGNSHTLTFTSATPADSGVYFCMMVGNPELIFGNRIQLTVVDVLPTTARPTKKPITKKIPCKPPKIQKGPPCGPIILGLLVAGFLILLVSLGVAIHQHCRRRRARLRYIKQFCK